jgi:hypothetical protein
MKIDKFLEINEKELINQRLKFEQKVREEADIARKRFYAYKSHKHYVAYLKARNNLKQLGFV